MNRKGSGAAKAMTERLVSEDSKISNQEESFGDYPEELPLVSQRRKSRAVTPLTRINAGPEGDPPSGSRSPLLLSDFGPVSKTQSPSVSPRPLSRNTTGKTASSSTQRVSSIHASPRLHSPAGESVARIPSYRVGLRRDVLVNASREDLVAAGASQPAGSESRTTEVSRVSSTDQHNALRLSGEFSSRSKPPALGQRASSSSRREHRSTLLDVEDQSEQQPSSLSGSLLKISARTPTSFSRKRGDGSVSSLIQTMRESSLSRHISNRSQLQNSVIACSEAEEEDAPNDVQVVNDDAQPTSRGFQRLYDSQAIATTSPGVAYRRLRHDD